MGKRELFKRHRFEAAFKAVAFEEADMFKGLARVARVLETQEKRFGFKEEKLRSLRKLERISFFVSVASRARKEIDVTQGKCFKLFKIFSFHSVNDEWRGVSPSFLEGPKKSLGTLDGHVFGKSSAKKREICVGNETFVAFEDEICVNRIQRCNSIENHLPEGDVVL
jgi:hypothetical protein